MRLSAVILGVACALTTVAHPAFSAPPATEAPILPRLPPPVEVRTAGRVYPVFAHAHTHHAGWTDTTAYVHQPQDISLRWHIDPGGSAVLKVRDAWDPVAPWRDLRKWERSDLERGETRLRIERPSLLWLRVRAARWPRSGVASLRADYERRTLAVLRGTPGKIRKPVIVAEGYDPFNEQDWNDPAWQDDVTFARLVNEGRRQHDLDPWILDWGDAAAPLQQQAEDFADLARQIRTWAGGQRPTVAVGISMGAVSLRYALAAAAESKTDLGVRKYISINGPHRGAWVNPELYRFLLKRGSEGSGQKAVGRRQSAEGSRQLAEAKGQRAVGNGLDAPAEDPDSPNRNPSPNRPQAPPNPLQRALGSPAAQQLIIGAPLHAAFYTSLRAQGENGYAPAIPRAAFSTGSLVKEGTDLAELVKGKAAVIHRVQVRPLWLPLWITVRKTRRDFRYGAFPGELLPESMRTPVKGHVRFLSIFRFDFRTDWEKIPTFIPTHSALDFPEELEGGPRRFRYEHWRQSAFPQIYVSQDRNLPHDATRVNWIDPRTGKPAPRDADAILHEIAVAYGPAGRKAARE